MAVAHHPDCDSYTNHEVRVEHERPRLWRAVCSTCDWRGTRVGRDARDLAHRERDQHAAMTPCDGSCREAS